MRAFHFLSLCLAVATIGLVCGDRVGAQSYMKPGTETVPVMGTERRAEIDEIPVGGLRRIFKGGFEEPVTLAPDSSGRQVRLQGRDAFGYSWDDLDHVFELVAPRSYGRLVTTEFRTHQVYAGKRSLFMRQNEEADGTQNRLQFFSDDRTFNQEIFTRRMYYIPSSNLRTLAKQEQSSSIAGTRETRGGSIAAGQPGADFSMPLYVVRRGDRLVFAQAIVDYSAGPSWSDWTRPPKGLLSYGLNTPCPLDRWFGLDIYILRHPVEGKIKVWLDGKLIFDLEKVRTKNDYDRWFTKLADVDSEPAPFELFVDNVEIWAR